MCGHLIRALYGHLIVADVACYWSNAAAQTDTHLKRPDCS